ncbi:ADP-forming succinate--CoA ligase subunit beta [Candidatus Marinamargulisbacteria bacterium SCGC AG-410-N11]|nr:ADP-forming succinate--CoA ligase subunit beta [Candidatus Marinamargulisbacteria bacterium SCGC AG-410-N11]
MKIHEYQAKNLLKNYGITIQDGEVVEREEDIESAIDSVSKRLNTSQFVIKAQIHAGGRGKGGGVKFSPNKESAIKNAKEILGMQLKTHQTTEEGQLVRKILITEAIDIAKEYYVAITLDRSTGKNVFMVSLEGGVEIEEVAAKTPEKIIKVHVDPAIGLRSFQALKLASALELSGDALKQGVKLFKSLYKCYIESDASIAEINPLVLTEQNELNALDAKFNFDGNALYRQKDILDMRDTNEEDPTEVEADKYHLNYIKLDGNVGCMVNGAGLAMATMDIIKLKGGDPANFLDVGGGANVETVKNGFKIILSDSNVKAVLINIFGGIVRCDRVANGIIQAVKELDLNIPVVVRLAGTNADLAKSLLESEQLDIIAAQSLEEAAQKVVDAATKTSVMH